MGRRYAEGANIKSRGTYIPFGDFFYGYSGIARAQGCKNHYGLHPCAESGPEGRAEPDGLVMK
jgi:hypothetical protein